MNRPLSDIFITDCTAIQLQSQQNKEYNGELSVRGNLIEMLTVHCHAVPVACIGKDVTHVILTLAVTIPTTTTTAMGQLADDVLATLPSPQQLQHRNEPRGSLHSLRRGSFDIRPFGSDALRRTSIAKLSALPLEAPITKVKIKLLVFCMHKNRMSITSVKTIFSKLEIKYFRLFVNNC